MKLVTLFVVVAITAACGAKPTAPPTSPTGSRDQVTAPPPSREPALPLWSEVKRGVLSNGLTYYVLPHHKPEKRAYLWLAVNAGAAVEDNDQRGLAHFVEHMAFNGTKRFPKNDLVKYLEGIGMKFGPDLNAYTAFDETVYQLQVPTDSAATVDKGFDILHDWATDLAFDPAEVDKERGVVLEEWRLGRGAGQRLLDQLIKVILKGSRYADRLPIGLPEVIKGAARDVVVRFYKDWYRPDLMAVVAVGDFDAAAIEQQIVGKFSDLAKPGNPRPRPLAGVPAADGTRVAMLTDKELPLSVVAVANLVPHRSKSTASDYRRMVIEQLYQAIVNERLQTLSRKPDAPFMNAAVIVPPTIVREVDALVRFAMVKDDNFEGALRSLFDEVTRIERHGFVQSELDRARAVMLRNYDQEVASAQTRDGREIVGELVRHYLEGELVLGPTGERDRAAQVLPTITLKELDEVAKSFGGANNRVIVGAGTAGKPLPTEARAIAIAKEAEAAKLAPWEDRVATAPLMEQLPKPGAVTKQSKIDKLGVTEWTLANGVRVIVKPTDFEKDIVSIVGSSPGGLAAISDRDFTNARFIDDIVAASGVGELDADALGKVLAGKVVSVAASINDVTEGIAARGSARDLEALLQLIHLRMAAPRKDEQAFAIWQRNTAEELANISRSPEAEFRRQLGDAMWQRHARRVAPTSATVKQVELDRAMSVFRDRFGDAADFTFAIVGEVDLAKLKPLVETYLGGLPASGRIEKERDDGARRAPGIVTKTWKLGQDQDKAAVEITYHADEPWSRDNERDMFLLSEVLSIRLREVLREDLGGVYGVRARGEWERSPRQQRTFTIAFGCAPAAVDKLVAAAKTEISAIAKNGIGQSYLDTAKQAFIRERETALKTNGFWTRWLLQAARFGDDPALVLDNAGPLGRMTSDNVKAAAARFLDGKRVFQAVMLPAK